MDNFNKPGSKEMRDKSFGAIYHPRYSTYKIVTPLKYDYAIVEFKGKISNKNDIPEYIDKVLNHLSTWGIENLQNVSLQQNLQNVNVIELKRKQPSQNAKSANVKNKYFFIPEHLI
jgi:hypothetical protein